MSDLQERRDSQPNMAEVPGLVCGLVHSAEQTRRSIIGYFRLLPGRRFERALAFAEAVWPIVVGCPPMGAVPLEQRKTARTVSPVTSEGPAKYGTFASDCGERSDRW